MRVFYYNITYLCNNRCYFCASDQTGMVNAEMALTDIISSFDKYCIGTGDKIILNGGEPSIHPQLIPIIKQASLRNAHVTVFSNGRELSNYSFARQIIEAGATRISSPLYGSNPHEHDSLTNIDGSFGQTIAGIKNIFKIKQVVPQLEIELKCLVCKPCLITNTRIINFIATEVGRPSIFIISGIIISQKVLNNRKEFIPSWSELRESVNSLCYEVEKHSFKALISQIPLCVLDKKYLDYYLNSIPGKKKDLNCKSKDGDLYIYFDPLQPMGVNNYKPRWNSKPSVCQNCKVAEFCTASLQFLQLIPGISLNPVLPENV